MNNPLQQLDKIQASQAIKDKTFDYIVCKQKKRNYIPLSIILVSVCVILTFISLQHFFPTSTSPIAYISLDINPSLEIELDNQYNIIQVKAYNEDAKEVIKKSQLQGLKFQEALEKLMQNSSYSKYLKDGILEIGVYSSNKKVSSQLEQIINKYMDNKLTTSQYHCSQINQETRDNATTHHMSAGKYRIIENILQYTQDYAIEDLNKMSIKELYTFLYQYDQTSVPENCYGHNSDSQGHHRHREK